MALEQQDTISSLPPVLTDEQMNALLSAQKQALPQTLTDEEMIRFETMQKPLFPASLTDSEMKIAENPSFLKTLGQEVVDKLGGSVETILSAGSAIAGFPAGVGAGLAKLAYDTWKGGGRDIDIQAAKEFGEKVSEKVIYQPKTSFGQTTVQVLAAPFAVAQEGIKIGAEAITSDPQAQAAITMAGDAALAFLIPKLTRLTREAGKFVSARIYEDSIRQVVKKGLDTGHTPEVMNVIENAIRKKVTPGTIFEEVKRVFGVRKAGVKEAAPRLPEQPIIPEPEIAPEAPEAPPRPIAGEITSPARPPQVVLDVTPKTGGGWTYTFKPGIVEPPPTPKVTTLEPIEPPTPTPPTVEPFATAFDSRGLGSFKDINVWRKQVQPFVEQGYLIEYGHEGGTKGWARLAGNVGPGKGRLIPRPKPVEGLPKPPALTEMEGILEYERRFGKERRVGPKLSPKELEDIYGYERRHIERRAVEPAAPQGKIPEKVSAPQGEIPPPVEILPEYTKEMAEAKAEAERLKKEAEFQHDLKAGTVERTPKEIKPAYNFTDIEKTKLAKDITYLTSGSKTPRMWREHPEQIEANRNELITHAYLKLDKVPNPAELKEFINNYARNIRGERLQTRKEQAEARVKQFPVVEGEAGRIEYDPSEEASIFGKQEPIEEKASAGKVADDILKEAASGDNRIVEIIKARHLSTPETFDSLGKRLGMTGGNVHHLYKKGMANLTDPDKMAERVARLKGNEGEKKAEELAKKMEADLGPTKVKAGLSVQMTHPPAPPTGGKPKFAFPEKIEERYQKAKKVPKPTVGEKAGGFLTGVRHGITRTYPNLPNTGENVEFKQALKRLEKAPSIIADKLVRTNRSMTYKLNADQYDLANRKIIVNDLLKEASIGHELPFGFDEATLKDVAPKLNDAIGDNPVILDVIKDRKELWDATRNDYIYWRDKVGHDVTAVLNNSDYFRHSILELMNKKRLVSGMGKKLRTHTGQSFLKKRAGSEMDILADFLQADHEVLSQMLYDIEEAKTIDFFRKKGDVSKKLRKEAKEKGVPIEDVIPEGYTKWQPKEGHTFYVADTLPAKVAEQILSGEIEDLGVVAESLRKGLAMGRERETWIIRIEVADTLDELKGPQKLTLAGEVFKDINLAWKWSALSLPRRTIKYNIRNLSGDAEHIAVGNPKTFLRFPRAFREMFEVYFGDRPLTGDALIFADRGGLQTTLQVQEITDIPKLPMFKNLYKASKLDDINIFKKYWRAVNKVSNFRESVGRYAAFLEYKRQMQKNPNGMPDNYGASIPEEIQGLADIDDRAFRLSNELLGGYDEVSATGQVLRRGIYPFWSWPEINTKFYFRIMKNAVYNDDVSLKMGKKMLKGTVAGAKVGIGTTLKIGRFAIRAMGLSILLAAYNNIFFPDEEKELPENVRYRAHINFGHDKDGKPVYFSRLGALSDFLQWFGMDAPQAHVADFLNGRKTIKEIAIDMAKAPINVLVSGISPFLKAPFELVTRQSLFPDVFKPSKIRDRGLYLSRQIGLEDEFRTIMGKPGKPYVSTLDQLALYKSDPLETAYYEIRDIKSDWLKKEGKESISFYLNPSSEALYNMKLALRYNEHKLVNKYAEQYAQIVILRHKGESENAIRKYIKDGITQSLENLHPLSGLKTSERKPFLLSLRPEERDVLAKALRFYNEILLGNNDMGKND